MDQNFFKTTRILDGGMGQELVARKKDLMELYGVDRITIEDWRRNRGLSLILYLSCLSFLLLLQLLLKKLRLRDNNVEDKFEYLNKKAGEIAQKAKEQYPNVLIAGGLPPQYLTYEEDIE